MNTQQKLDALAAEERKQADLYGYFDGAADIGRAYRKAKKRHDKAIARLKAERDALAETIRAAQVITEDPSQYIYEGYLAVRDILRGVSDG